MLQETNNKEQSVPPTPVKTGLFIVACKKVRIVTPRQLRDIVLHDSPQQASTTTSVSSDRAGVLAAIDTSLTSADKATKLLLSSGSTVPVEAERVLKQAALARATKYFEDDSKEGLALLTAMLQKFSMRINTKANKANTTLAEMPRACVTPGDQHFKRRAGHMAQCSTVIGAKPVGLYIPPIQFQYIWNLMDFNYLFTETTDYPW